MTAGPPEADGRAQERALVLAYAPAAARDALTALLALDDRLGEIVRVARDPMIGQMRLTWWFEALERLDVMPPPAEPILTALHAHVVPVVGGAALAGMVDGWERVLDDAPDDAAIDLHAAARGGALFGFAARLLGEAAPDQRVTDAGRGWALAERASRGGDVGAARDVLSSTLSRPWPRHLRALGAMAWLTRLDMDRPDRPAGHPARAARLLWHRLTGR